MRQPLKPAHVPNPFINFGLPILDFGLGDSPEIQNLKSKTQNRLYRIGDLARYLPDPPTHLPLVHSSIAGNTLEHELAGTAALPDGVEPGLRAASRCDTPIEAVLQLHVQEGRDDR